MKKETLIVLPAFNEEQSIGGVIAALLDADTMEFADILVIDDGSKDSTAVIAKDFGVGVISHALNVGYGAALMTGYRFAAKNGYKHLIQIDADGQHDACNVPRIHKEMTSADAPDIILGSRFLAESETFKIPWIKLAAIKGFRMIVKIAAGKKISDPTSGLQGLNRAAFTYYSEYNKFDYRYPDANMLIKMLSAGFSIQEIPCVVHERAEGESMHSGLRAVLYMLCMPLSIASVCLDGQWGRRGRRK